jgi:hypothetical protein
MPNVPFHYELSGTLDVWAPDESKARAAFAAYLAARAASLDTSGLGVTDGTTLVTVPEPPAEP